MKLLMLCFLDGSIQGMMIVGLWLMCERAVEKGDGPFGVFMLIWGSVLIGYSTARSLERVANYK